MPPSDQRLTIDPRRLALLRADLSDHYTVDAVEAALGPMASAALHREQPLAADLMTVGSSDPSLALTRCFALGRPTRGDWLDAALPRLGLAEAIQLGLICPVGDGMVRAMCDLRPYAADRHDYVVASDLSELAIGGPLRPDHVLGIGGASTTLASWTVRGPVGRALDLGTGCGVQALHLVGHADQVVATDISTRAIDYAAFNAALNGAEFDLRVGSMLEPVAGERFDLIVSNPPFVITPRVEHVPLYEYRDGGKAGDGIVADLVRQVGDHLVPGGIAQFLGNWEIPRSRSWRQVWDGWLEGTGLDAWVVQREEQDPAEYAELWCRDGGARSGTADYEQMYAAWLADFAARDVAAIGFGVVTVQRPATSREPWRDLMEFGGPVAPAMGETVARGLEARNWLADNGVRGLLAQRWQCASDVTEERHYVPGAPDPSVILTRQGGGLGRSLQLSTQTAAFLGVCDGELTAGQALDAIASVLEMDVSTVVAGHEQVLRDLVADGFLVLADHGS